MSENPKLSIAVCTRNREDVLPKCLESLVNQTASSGLFEVLIVDNNSTDDTKKIALDFCEKHSNFKYVFEEKQGHSQARNRAIAEANGKYLAYIDDDAIADGKWVESILDCFSQTDADAVGGPVQPFIETDKDSPFFYDVRSHKFDCGNERKRMLPPGFDFGFSTCNVCFKRSLFNEVGLFSENFGIVNGKLQMGEDSEM